MNIVLGKKKKKTQIYKEIYIHMNRLAEIQKRQNSTNKNTPYTNISCSAAQ